MIVLLSGGLDSAVLLGKMDALGGENEALSVNYGQRHARELIAAHQLAAHYHVQHTIVDLSSLGPLLSGSALTEGAEVPEGHYSAESMAVTVVPNRNMIMLAIATGIAAARGHSLAAAAMHAGDHPIYPDCRPEFIAAASEAAHLGTAGHGDVRIVAPFIRMTKAEIVTLGDALHVPLELTWSCYKGGKRHCGRCGTCVERAEAFDLARVPDPTGYDDPDYFRTATGAAS